MDVIMKLKHFTLLFGTGIMAIANAQTKVTADAAIGIGSKAQTVALAGYRLHQIGKSQKFSLGYGIRFTGFTGKNVEYLTAPADVSEGNFFKPQNVTKMDTLTMNGSVGSLNAAIYIDYQISSKWSVQFNIDAIGISFGGEQTGSFYSQTQGFPKQDVKAKPTSSNLLLTGDYDLGSLNSEFSGKYHFNDNSALKFGLSFVFTEYTTATKLAFNNDRFRAKNLMPMVGYSHTF
jgi:hypothetical protein